MKLSWADIQGQGASRPEAGAALPGATESSSPVDLLGRANSFLDDALDMLRKLDQVVGIFLQLKGGQKTIEGERGTMEDQPGAKSETGNASPGNPQAPDTPQILALLDAILAGEGDIPLSRFVNGIRNQEAWLVKYATEVMDAARS